MDKDIFTISAGREFQQSTRRQANENERALFIQDVELTQHLNKLVETV